ncbi:hypothetical protein AV521_45825 [Streptomyces sp. IMTB 2501]|nr:hypothetical protein AV521_45825 [Streptomyces sp. IMTB 2501]
MLENADTADGSAADFWSLAKTLWTLLSGQNYPLPGEYHPDPAYSLRSWTVYPWVDALDLLIRRCTRLAPDKRPSMAHFAEELRNCMAEPPEIASDADAEVLRKRLASLTDPTRQTLRAAQEERQRLEELATDLAAFDLEVQTLIDGMLGGNLQQWENAHPSHVNSFQERSAWSLMRHMLYQSPGDPSRVWVWWLMNARIPNGGADRTGREEMTLDIDLRVIHRHDGLEHASYVLHESFSAPLGSATFARILESAKALVAGSEKDLLTEVTRIAALPDDHVPEWFPSTASE